jgi:hypothetical protein
MTTKKDSPRVLHLGETIDGEPFTLPVDAAGARFVVLGKSKAGKTNTDAVIIEEVYGAGVAPVVLDPLGNMWGLRAGAEDETAGIPVVIFGGRARKDGGHMDLPLSLDRAEYLADLIAEGVPSVLDLSQLPGDQYAPFADAFLPRLLQRAERYGRNLFVVAEEGDRFARNTGKSTPTTTWARAARNGGIGWLFSTHKPQLVHKEIIDTADVFLPMKMTGELAQDAIGGEIGSRIGKRLAVRMIDDLPRFRRGEAWFVPDSGWLNDDADWEPQRVLFRKRRTYHVEPPRVGEVRREPKLLAALDLERINAAIEREERAAKEDDPKALRARITELERARQGPADPGEVRRLEQRVAELEARPPERVEVPVLREGEPDRLRVMVDELRRAAADVMAVGAGIGAALEAAVHAAASAPISAALQSRADGGASVRKARATVTAPAAARRSPAPDLTGDLGQAPAAVLGALATYKDGRVTRKQVAALTGYSVRKSTLRNALSALRTRALIETPDDEVVLTAAGRKLAGPAPAPKSTAETIAMWRDKLEQAPRALLDVLVAAHPRFVDRTTLGTKAGVDPTKSTLRNALSRLRVQGLIDEQGDGARASDELFPTGPVR